MIKFLFVISSIILFTGFIMPEESINIFISNIYSIAIFSVVILIIFLTLFLISKIFIRRGKKNRTDSNYSDAKPRIPGQVFSLNKDTDILKTLLVTGILFVLMVLLVLLIMLSMYFVTNFKMDSALYMIFAIVFLILVLTVYIVKSKIIRK